MAFELQAFGRNRHGGAGMQAERMSDTELVEGIRAGETACYGALVDRHHRRLFRAAHRIVRNEADAEDALQEAYLHSFRRLEQFEGRSAVVTWMTRIAINEAFTCVRQRVPWNSLDAPLAGARNPVDFLAAPVRNPEQQAIGHQIESRIRAAVAELPEDYQDVFRLREIEGANTEDTAARLGISESCVKTRLFRAKRLLQKRLGATLPG
jgi:RNA polymerase sigma-70 factor (ECF subfamily)